MIHLNHSGKNRVPAPMSFFQNFVYNFLVIRHCYSVSEQHSPSNIVISFMPFTNLCDFSSLSRASLICICNAFPFLNYPIISLSDLRITFMLKSLKASIKFNSEPSWRSLAMTSYSSYQQLHPPFSGGIVTHMNSPSKSLLIDVVPYSTHSNWTGTSNSYDYWRIQTEHHIDVASNR